MKENKRYVLNVNGLALGKHEYFLNVDDDFFSYFQNPEVAGGNARIDILLTKGTNIFSLDFAIKGEIKIACDRCLEEFMAPVKYQGTLLVKYSDEEKESDGDVMWIPHNENVIDIAQYIYESIMLSLPYQRIHPEDKDGIPGCDPEMLKRFRIITEDEFKELYPEDPDKGDESWKELLEGLKDKMDRENNNE